ncbi:MAG: hypothetical protein ABIQ36_02520 [Rhodanobacter sp.]
MAGKNSDVPDSTVVAEIRQMIGLPKAWVASGEMAWVDAGGRPRGSKFRERLALPDGSQPANLFVECYFKPSSIQGSPDKLSISLFFNHHRVLAIDENGPSSHINNVGLGRPYFGKRVGHPQVHTISDDCIYGYAEPLESMSLERYWDYFISEAGITDAPSFQLPILQLGLSV